MVDTIRTIYDLSRQFDSLDSYALVTIDGRVGVASVVDSTLH